MQVIMRNSRRFWIGAVLALTLTVCGTGAAADAPMPVELWRGGDDGLTQKLYVALENAFTSSADFTLTGEGTAGTLVVMIPTHVEWRRRLWRTRIIYTVEFRTKDDQLIGLSKGSCWEGSVKKCAKQVLKDAKIAAAKVPQGRVEEQKGDQEKK